MPFTQSDVDALKSAIVAGRGARSMTFSDQSITFNSIDEMLKLLSVMQQEVNSVAGAGRTYRLAATRKGV